MDAPQEKKPRRMKANLDFMGDPIHGVEHDENELCKHYTPCVPVEPEPAKEDEPCRMQANLKSMDPYHREEHIAVWTCVGDPVCIPVEPAIVGSATEAELHGEPFYPWPDAPEGTVAAAYDKDLTAFWILARIIDERFYVDYYEATGASLNGCPWEKSLRVNPMFGTGNKKTTTTETSPAKSENVDPNRRGHDDCG
jgi:hypothetical protein